MSTLADSISIKGTAEAPDRRRRIIAIIGAFSGNLVDWYDFYAYAFPSIYFARISIPNVPSTTAPSNASSTRSAPNRRGIGLYGGPHLPGKRLYRSCPS